MPHALQNEDYRLRFAVSEWSKIEYELTRERGLWGPEIPSKLDKWMLDTVEGNVYVIMWFHACMLINMIILHPLFLEHFIYDYV